jgi:hypothetical protein
MDETQKEFKKVSTYLKEILVTHPETREGGPLLSIIQVWVEKDGLPQWIAEQLKNHHMGHGLTDTETIRRSRQKLQNKPTKEGEYNPYRPEGDTARQRAYRAKKIKSFISK